jgi:hypothetical protein
MRGFGYQLYTKGGLQAVSAMIGFWVAQVTAGSFAQKGSYELQDARSCGNAVVMGMAGYRYESYASPEGFSLPEEMQIDRNVTLEAKLLNLFPDPMMNGFIAKMSEKIYELTFSLDYKSAIRELNFVAVGESFNILRANMLGNAAAIIASGKDPESYLSLAASNIERASTNRFSNPGLKYSYAIEQAYSVIMNAK